MKNRNKCLKIKLSHSPAKYIDHVIIDVEKIVYSYGGGMGGISKTLFALDSERLENGFYKILQYTEEFIQVNERFIVSKEPSRLLLIHSDITEQRNYHSKVCDKCTLYEYAELFYDEDVEIDLVNGNLPQWESFRFTRSYSISK